MLVRGFRDYISASMIYLTKWNPSLTHLPNTVPVRRFFIRETPPWTTSGDPFLAKYAMNLGSHFGIPECFVHQLVVQLDIV
jgi:hypothetical protein